MKLYEVLLLLVAFWVFCGMLWFISECMILPAIQKHRQRERERRTARKIKLELAIHNTIQDDFNACYERLRNIKED